MIKTIAHKGLERFFTKGSKAGIQPHHAAKLRLILALIDQARVVSDVGAPGLDLHPLKGTMAGYWSVSVQATWRVIFKFENGDAYLLDYLDYH